jgi:hypoxanthine phosphoribosyltransferase
MEEIISTYELNKKMDSLALKIHHQYLFDNTDLVFVGILNGAFMFFSDLVKKIQLPMEIDFVRVKSYEGQNRKEIKFTKDLEVNIKGKHIYLVDDIIDSGHTIKFLMDHFKKRGAKKITPIAAILKENVVIKEALCILQYPQNSPWFIGYGMDDEYGKFRNLDTIFKINGK